MRTLKLVCIIALICVTYITQAQDVIVKTDQTTIVSKVTKISETEIEYKKWSNLDGPTYVISISEVASINYQNGEVESFNKSSVTTQEVQIVNQEVAIPTNGLMERSGKYLTLDGRRLTDDEVLELVGYDNYQTYIEAQQHIKVGNTFATIAIIALATSLIPMPSSDYDVVFQVLFINNLAFAVISIPIIIFNIAPGKSRLNWVASEYNRQQYNSSISFSPSLIKCETPQLQNTNGLGLTFSMKF